MTDHNHSSYVDGCFRCDLSRDEAGTLSQKYGDLLRSITPGDTELHKRIDRFAPVGEAGPEIVNLPAGTRVYPRSAR